MKKFLNFFLALLIVFLPFQQLLTYYFSSVSDNSRLVFWSMHFYEPFILILVVISVFRFIFLPKKKGNLPWQVVVFTALLLGLYSIFFISPSWRQGLEGFRFTLMPLALLLGVSGLGDWIDSNKLIKIYLWTATIAALWAIAERFLPPNYWQMIIPNIENGYGTFLVGGTEVQRSASFLLGANQLGSYIIPAFFIAVSQIMLSKPKWLPIALAAVLFLAVFFSFSRAALLGLLISLFVYLFL